MATLSSSPDSLVPGRDYPNSQLSALKLSCGGGGGVCLVCDKVEMGRGGMGQGVTERGRCGGGMASD